MPKPILDKLERFDFRRFTELNDIMLDNKKVSY